MLKKLSIGLVNIYQRQIRACFPASCRFYPSCSDYAKEAILKYGFFPGIYRAMKRLLSCHPFSGRAGYDPVP